MKKLIFILFLMPALGFSQPVTDGLVGYWPFNGNANDESGNGNDGVVNGAILTMDRFGNANSAYVFDGNYDYVKIDAIINDLNATTTGTWSVWVKPLDATPSNVNTILSFSDTNTDQRIWLRIGTSGNTKAFARIGGTTRWRLDTDQINFSENSWTHIAIVQDGISPILYINAVAVPQTFVVSSNTELWFNNLNDLDNGRIGNINFMNRGEENFMRGSIDDAMIFNRALTEQEIQSLYSGEAPPPPPELCNTLYCDGENIGIGTPNTQGYKLAVAGDFIAQKVKVALQDQWPDYVFDEEYKLEDLQQLEQYIKIHKHLPNIPDAETIENNGYELSDMDAKLLEKIEELSLYIIQQEKKLINQQREIDIQSKLNQNQERKIEALEGQHEQLKSQQREIELLKQRLDELESQ